MSQRLAQSSIILIVLFQLWVASVHAGDIPGIPVMQPPSLMGDLQFQFANDFFSYFSNTDDFRTQQLSVSGWITNNWLITIDQSFLTVRGPNVDLPDPVGTEGRLDQLSATLGYRIYQNYDPYAATLNQLLLGGGIRSYGNYQGSRIQNGFHNLFHSRIVRLPYVATRQDDAVIWIRGSREAMFTNDRDMHNPVAWQFGYWLDGTALVTSDGQTDGSLGVFGLARHKNMEFWTGIRGDLRQGYDRDIVQMLTAENERGISLALGLSIGPIRIETVEGLGKHTGGFGRLVFAADRNLPFEINTQSAYMAYQFSLLSPKSALQHQLRWSPNSWNSQAHDYRLAAVLDYRTASPADNDLATKFIISDQLIIGVEATYNTQNRDNWFNPYVMLGAGYRSELIEGQAVLDGQNSRKVESGVIVLDVGARFNMAGNPDRWLIQLQIGATGWLPLNEQQVEFNSQSETLLKPDLSLSMGVSVSMLF